MSILTVIPRPTPLRLGGVGFLASPYRLGDLATIQGFIDSRLPSPFSLAGDAILRGTEKRSLPWRKLLAGTLELQAEWPKVRGTPEADEVLATAEGRTLMIALGLAEKQPLLTPADHRAIYQDTTAEEWSVFQRFAWGDDPLRAMLELIDGPKPNHESKPTDWAQLWYDYTTGCPNGPPFDRLTLTQLRVWLRRGKTTTTTASDRQDWEKVAERRAEFWGSITPEG